MMGKVGMGKNLFSKENMPHIKQNLENFFDNWMLRKVLLSEDVSKDPQYLVWSYGYPLNPHLIIGGPFD